MKNNGKKLLAGLGIGLTLASGSMMMTGCTNVNLTDAQVDKLITIIETETTQNEKERIFDMIKLGFYKMTTCGDILDNLRVTCTMKGGSGYELILSYYKKQDGKRFFMNVSNNEMMNDPYVVIEKENSKCLIVDSQKQNKEFENITFAASVDKYLYIISNNMAVVNSDFQVVDYQILDNGNYMVNLCFSERNSENIFGIIFMDIELTKDGIIKNCLCREMFNDYEIYQKYEYGVITESEVNKVIAEVEALPEVENN